MLASPVFAQNEALRGKMAMSVYVSIYGGDQNAAELRLSLEQQLHDIGITVLPHASPPNFPVLNLTIDVRQGIQRTVITRGDGSVSSNDMPTATYSSTIELRQLAPGQTPAMRPIKDVAVWSKASNAQTVRGADGWKIPIDALDLGIES